MSLLSTYKTSGNELHWRLDEVGSFPRDKFLNELERIPDDVPKEDSSCTWLFEHLANLKIREENLQPIKKKKRITKDEYMVDIFSL
jgi:hypothetical protein